MPAKDIVNFEDYVIDTDGWVFSKKRNKYLKIQHNTKGYPSVRLYNKEGGSTVAVHRLVAEHFLPRVDGLDQIDHIDNNKKNNHISNLRWVNNQTNTEKELAKVHYLVHRNGTGVYVFNLRKWCESLGYDQATFYKMKSKQRKSAYGYVEIEVYYPC